MTPVFLCGFEQGSLTAWMTLRGGTKQMTHSLWLQLARLVKKPKNKIIKWGAPILRSKRVLESGLLRSLPS